MGKTSQQESEETGPIAPPVVNQREMNAGAERAYSLLFRSGSQPMR